jgi:putative tryptophan/tyrosine transport system substrate-binding protein
MRRKFWRAFVRVSPILVFIEGQNVTVIYRYADGQYERLPVLVAELVVEQVGVIVTEPSSPAALAAKRATSTIPIVFFIGIDPIGLGLISSYNRPGANVTGINVAPESLTAKRFEWLNDRAAHHRSRDAEAGFPIGVRGFRTPSP